MAIGADSIKALLLTVGFDASEVNSGVRKLDQSVQKSVTKIGRTIAGLFGAAAIRNMVRNFAAISEEVGRVSQRIGIGANELNTWQLAVERAGGSSAGLTNTLQSLSDQLRQVSIWGRGEVVYSFARLGISVRDANGNLRTSTELLTELSGVAERVGKQRFITIAERLGIDRPTIDLLMQGREAVQRSLQDMSGMAVEDADVKVAMDFNRAWLGLTRTFERFAAIFIRRVLPVFTRGVDKLTDWINVVRKNQPFLFSFIATLAGLLSVLLVPALVSTATWAWRAIAPFLPFLAVVLILAALFEDFYSYVNGGPSELADFWSQFGTGEEILESTSAAFENVKTQVLDLIEALRGLKPYTSEYLQELNDAASLMGRGFVMSIKGVLEGDMPKLFNGLVDLVIGFVNLVVAPLNWLARKIVDIFSDLFLGLADTVRDAFMAAIDYVLASIKRLVRALPDRLLPDSVADWARETSTAAAEFALSQSVNAIGAPGNAITAARNAIATTIDNTRIMETVVNVGGIEIVSSATDPRAVATEAVKGLSRQVFNSSRGVRQ